MADKSSSKLSVQIARQRTRCGTSSRATVANGPVRDPAHSGLTGNPPFRDLQVVSRVPEILKPSQRNARIHSDRQIAQITASIRTFGFVNPIIIDEEERVLVGHGRLAAAKALGLHQVPTICLRDMTEPQKRAYALADNRLAELAKWDRELLAIELEELSALNLDFSVEVTGFVTAEIDLMIDNQHEDKAHEPADDVPEAAGPAVTRPGDLWVLGSHRLLCGDALDPASYEKLMAGRMAQAAFTDPPYNVKVQGHVSGLGRAKHAEFAMASGEMSEAEFTAFLQQSLECLRSSCLDGALFYLAMDWRHATELMTAAAAAHLRQINLCVWAKTNGGMGSFYRSQHELIFVYKHGAAPHINNVELGRHGRYRTNVWQYAGANTFRRGRDEDLADHPTVKPVALVADAIRDCTRRGDIVLDAFAGSGTTILAAERTGRAARALELEPRYVDVAIRRWEKLTGKSAIHAETGVSFSELAATRLAEVQP